MAALRKWVSGALAAAAPYWVAAMAPMAWPLDLSAREPAPAQRRGGQDDRSHRLATGRQEAERSPVR